MSLLEAASKMIGRNPTLRVCFDVYDERKRQDEKWGEQNHPDGLTGQGFQEAAERTRDAIIKHVDLLTKIGCKTWADILEEEFREAIACGTDEEHLRRELIQVAAVCVAWVEAIDRRGAK